MSRNACLAIGIADAPPLTYLGGAVAGAKALGAWANKAGYITEVLTDEENPVRLEQVKSALAKLLPNNEPTDRLLICFAGHGLQRGMEDLWLLSQWLPKNEAISVAALRFFLERYDLRQLVIVSDACRKAATTADTAVLTANPGIDRGPVADHRIHTDMLRATSSYTAAFMLRGRSEEDDRCLFSSLLSEALSGGVDDAFMERNGQRSIFSDSLATWLEKAVPETARRYGLELAPHIESGLLYPNDIYLAAPPTEKPVLPAWPEPADIASVSLDVRNDGVARVTPPPGRSWSTRVSYLSSAVPGTLGDLLGGTSRERSASFEKDVSFAEAVPPTAQSKTADLEHLILLDRERADRRLVAAERTEANMQQVFQTQQRPTHFETRAGFSVSGARAQQAWLGTEARASDAKGGAWWRIEQASLKPHFWNTKGELLVPLPLVVELDDGRWCGAAAMPGFVATFGVDAVGITSLVCRQMEDPNAQSSEMAIAYHAAGTLAEQDLVSMIVDMRASKHQDPVLGVLASYLHDRMGDIDNIHRVAFYFADARQAIPFDVALLGRLIARRRPDGLLEVTIPPVPAARGHTGRAALPPFMRSKTKSITGLVAGAFPWLREGWSLLDPNGQTDLYPAGLARLAVEVSPAPFTTLSRSGGQTLIRLLGG